MVKYISQKDIPDYRYESLRGKELLKHIIITSRDILYAQIDHGRLEILNEADLKLQFSYILKKVSELFSFGSDHFMKIHLEVPFESEFPLLKSGTTKSKIDILLEWHGGTNRAIGCAIELKFLGIARSRSEQYKNQYNVLCDFSNLESYLCYQTNDLNPWIFSMGYFLLGTTDNNYVYNNSTVNYKRCFDFQHNANYIAGTELNYIVKNQTKKTITLKQNYNFHWQKLFSNFYVDHFIEKIRSTSL